MKRRTMALLFGFVALTVIVALAVMLVLRPRPPVELPFADPTDPTAPDRPGEPAEPPPESERGRRTVELFFSNVERDPDAICDRVFAVERTVPAEIPAVEAALRALLAGPTSEERARGYSSFFSSATAGAVRAVRSSGDTVYLDLRDSREALAGANSSCGSAALLAQLERTAAANGGYSRVIVAFEGDPEPFYEWLQIGCIPENRFCDAAPFERGS